MRAAISLHYTVHLSDEEGLNEDAIRAALLRNDRATIYVVADDISEALMLAGWHPIDTYPGGLTLQAIPDPPNDAGLMRWAEKVP